MRIAYITAGAAGMYCGSCLHDNTLAAELIAQGEDVLLVPTYTPLRTDETDVSIGRVFFGGINVYLQEKVPLFRHTPWWFDRLLDSPTLLERLSRRAGSVDPSQLGSLTVSMLQGEAGHLRKEVEKLVDWLIKEVQSDVVHLSNSMQVGMARLIRERGGPPVVCQLSGEDLFIEKLVPPFYEEARAHLRERAADVAAFVALNNYYADFMAEYLSVDRSRMHVIPHGVKLEGHRPLQPPAEPGAAGEKYATASMSQDPRNNSRMTSACAFPLPGPPPKGEGEHEEVRPRVVGFLARICEDKGLHQLVEACELLAARDDMPAFELHAAGYLGANDRPYLEALERRAATGPLAGRFRYHGELDRSRKIAFLQSLDVFSTPTVYRESKGMPALEAMANAVPVVLPDHGGFTEMIADTGGGVLHRPHDVADLAGRLAELLRDPDRATQFGVIGQRAMYERYNAAEMARRTAKLYRTLLAK